MNAERREEVVVVACQKMYWAIIYLSTRFGEVSPSPTLSTLPSLEIPNAARKPRGSPGSNKEDPRLVSPTKINRVSLSPSLNHQK
jgi:hypothetical protein